MKQVRTDLAAIKHSLPDPNSHGLFTSPRRFMIAAVATLIVFSVLGQALGQTAPVQIRSEHPVSAPTSLVPEIDARPPSAGIILRPGDTILVTIFDTPELSTETRVATDGSINLPLINSLSVAGLSEAEAGRRIDSAYLHAKILLHPQTSVLIRSFAAKGVAITGEVVHPGLYPVAGQRSLLDIIAEAGGLTSSADTRVDIQRANGTLEHVIRLPVDDSPLALSNDVSVFPGDHVICRRSGTIFVLGEVARPGGYLMQYDGVITLLQAIAQASGTTKTANENGAILLRRRGDSYTMQHIEIGKIYKGKLPDFNLEPRDVVYVPNSLARNFIVHAPEILGTLAGAAIYSVNR